MYLTSLQLLLSAVEVYMANMKAGYAVNSVYPYILVENALSACAP